MARRAGVVPMLVLTSRFRTVDQLAFAADGGTLYAAGKADTDSVNSYVPPAANAGVEVWRPIAPNAPITILFPRDHVRGLLIAAGRLVANLRPIRRDHGAFGIGWHDPRSGESGRYAADFDRVPALAAAGDRLVAWGQPSADDYWERLYFWRAKPYQTPPAWQAHADDGGHLVHRAAISANGRRLVCHETHGGNLLIDQTHTLAERSWVDGTVVRRVPLPARRLAALAYSPDGRWLAAACGAAVLVWPAADLAAAPTRLADFGRLGVTGIAFHPGGRHLTVVANGPAVRTYDTTSWQLASTLEPGVGNLRSIAVSPDGLLAAAGADAGRVAVWDADP